MSKPLLQKAIEHNGDDYIKRLSKTVARKQLKRAAERSSKRLSSPEAGAKADRSKGEPKL